MLPHGVNSAAPDENTVFGVGSVTKLMVTLSVLDALARGAIITLDDAVPPLRMLNPFQANGVVNLTHATLRAVSWNQVMYCVWSKFGGVVRLMHTYAHFLCVWVWVCVRVYTWLSQCGTHRVVSCRVVSCLVVCSLCM